MTGGMKGYARMVYAHNVALLKYRKFIRSGESDLFLVFIWIYISEALHAHALEWAREILYVVRAAARDSSPPRLKVL